jgi:hypothetical protein
VATPGMLVQVMAKTLGIPAPTVTQFDRVLAENGLRSKGGRGNSAAQVTAGDAANLLIALLASPVQGAALRDAALSCQTYGGMPMLARASEPKEFVNFYGLKSLKALPAGGYNFSQALEALIRGTAGDRGEFKWKPYGEIGRAIRGADRWFNITVQGPAPWACFEVMYSADEPPTPRMIFTDTFTSNRSRRDADMWQTRHVSYRTIRALGGLVSGPPESGA